MVYTPGLQPIHEESEVREAFMSIHPGIPVHPEDMTLHANVELGDFGARRRR
jgi:hypothetical protein